MSTVLLTMLRGAEPLLPDGVAEHNHSGVRPVFGVRERARERPAEQVEEPRRDGPATTTSGSASAPARARATRRHESAQRHVPPKAQERAQGHLVGPGGLARRHVKQLDEAIAVRKRQRKDQRGVDDASAAVAAPITSASVKMTTSA